MSTGFWMVFALGAIVGLAVGYLAGWGVGSRD